MSVQTSLDGLESLNTCASKRAQLAHRQCDILMVERIFLLSVTYRLRLYTLVGNSREILCNIILQVVTFELTVRHHHHSMFCMLVLKSSHTFVLEAVNK